MLARSSVVKEHPTGSCALTALSSTPEPPKKYQDITLSTSRDDRAL